MGGTVEPKKVEAKARAEELDVEAKFDFFTTGPVRGDAEI